MDIKLSKRMQAVADMVKEKRVVDIGCDHAFVSIYLAGKPTVDSVIAMDVKTGPVDIARANISAYGLGEKIQLRMSDGFNELKVGEADVAVIAGMGGYLMIDILERGIGHLKNGISLVLQPQSDIPEVRRYLDSVGYIIEEENMLIDEGKYYSLMRAIPRGESSVSYSEEDYVYGPKLLEEKHPVLKSYLKFTRDKNIELMDKLKATGSEKSQERLKQLVQELNYNRYILRKNYGEDACD